MLYKNEKKINSVQYLRAIAAILVVYAHSLNFVGKGDSFQANFYYLKSFGAIGVDIFFIISGFIIAYISSYLNGFRKSLDFIKKRFIRVNLIYYSVSLLALTLKFISKPNESFQKNEFMKTITVVPLFDGGEKFWKPILYVGWTLAYEWLFYLVYFLLILFKFKYKNNIIKILFLLAGLIGFIFPINNIQYIFLTNPIALEFCLGVFLASIILNDNYKLSLELVLGCIILGTLWYLFVIFKGYGINAEANSNINSIYYWDRFFLWGLPSALIVYGFVFAESINYISFNNKTLVFLGDASFSIYLMHTIVISFVNKSFAYIKGV